MDDDVDVYDDMFEVTTSEDVEKLKNEIEERNRVIQSQRTQLIVLENTNKNLSHKNERLSTNISSIFLTAKRELRRKENTINELRQKIDDILFRRHRLSDKNNCSAIKCDEAESQKVKKDSMLIQPAKSRHEESADGKYSSRQYSGKGVDRDACDSRQLSHDSAKSAREYSRRSSAFRDYRRKEMSRNEDPYEKADCVSSSRNHYNRDENKKYTCGRLSRGSRSRQSSDYRRTTKDCASRSSQSPDDYVGDKSRISRERPSCGNVVDGGRSAQVARNDRNEDYQQRAGTVPRCGKSTHEVVVDSRRPCRTDSGVRDDLRSARAAPKIVNGRPEEIKSVSSFDYDNTPLKIVQREINRYSTFKFISPLGATPDHIKDRQNEINAKIGPVPMLNEFRVLEENGTGCVCVDTGTAASIAPNAESKVTVDRPANVTNDKTDTVDSVPVPTPSVSLLKNGSVARDDLNDKSVTISCGISEAEHGVFSRKRKRPFRVMISS